MPALRAHRPYSLASHYDAAAAFIASGPAEPAFSPNAGERSVRLKLKSRKIVLSNDGAADRILHFAALVLPSDEAMFYLINVFYLIGACAPVASWRNK
jgi:hypothetical protein